MLKFLPVAVLLLASVSAFAQGSTQTPPAPGSSASEAQSSNSLPATAPTMNLNSTQNPNVAGSNVGGTTPQPVPTTRP